MISVYVATKEPFFELRDANCVTMGQRASYGKDFTPEQVKEYYRKSFMAEHSTIEIISIRIVDTECRGDVINQIVRATKGHPRFQVQSSRPDWNNGEKRKPSSETWRIFSSWWNPLSFMQMARQRLCGKAMKETREWVESVIDAMKGSSDPLLQALAVCCVPQCVYRGGKCHEIRPCGTR